jgi:hypothetical protein
MKYVPALAALVLLTGCTAASPGSGPSSVATSPAPGGSQSAPSERPRPDCVSVSQSVLKGLAKGIESADTTIAKGAAVKLPSRLRQHGYTQLVGVTLGGPGVDGQGTVLAVGKSDVDPLPVDDLARNTFTKGLKVKAGSSLGKYQTKLAASESATDALVCAAAQ